MVRKDATARKKWEVGSAVWVTQEEVAEEREAGIFPGLKAVKAGRCRHDLFGLLRTLE